MKKPSPVFDNRSGWLLMMACIGLFALSLLVQTYWPALLDIRSIVGSRGSVARSLFDTLAGWHAVGGLVVVGGLALIVSSTWIPVLVLGVLACAYTLFWGAWVVADMMTGVGINQSVVFHIFSGTEGADHSQFLREIIVFGCFLACALAMLAFSIFTAWTRRPSRGAGPASARPAAFGAHNALGCLILGLFLFGAGWLASPWHRDIVALTHTYSTLDDAQARRMQSLYNTDRRAISRDKNLVVLYLESFESTYFDETLFPDLLPRLRALRGESAYFSGIEQTPGAGWTIAGLVNTQCGLPLVTPGRAQNDMGNSAHFLPRAKCLSEYLVDNGFETLYMGGAAGGFASKDLFLEQHGFQTVRDRQYFSQWKQANNGLFADWGAYDDELLDSVYDQFVAQSERNTPFALFALTMDTHAPHGHVSPSCRDVSYGDGDIKTLNATRCADRLVSRFIERVRRSPYYKNTRMVVLSDHLSMVNDAKPLIDKADKRENLMMVFDTDLAPGERKVQGTMLDVGPTILSLMKADQTELGFGRSLLEPAHRQNDAYSADYFATGDVTEYLSFSRELWRMPRIAGEVTSDGETIVLGGNRLAAPFFSVLDSNNNVVALYFRDFAKHIGELKQGARYLYALDCKPARDAEGGLCLISGLKGMGERVFSSTELIDGVSVSDILTTAAAGSP